MGSALYVHLFHTAATLVDLMYLVHDSLVVGVLLWLLIDDLCLGLHLLLRSSLHLHYLLASLLCQAVTRAIYMPKWKQSQPTNAKA